jgi:hypothetical protein
MKSTFAQILERHIRRAGLSVTRLASQAQIPKQTLFNWCDGRMPRWHAGLPTELARLARALGLNTQESEELLQAAGCVCAVDTPRFEEAESDDWKLPRGWIRAGSEPAAYDMGVDPQVRCQQAVAATLRSRSPSTGGFGTLMQMCMPTDYLDKRVRFSAQTRTEDVVDWAGLWMRIDGERGEAPLGFDNMQSRPLVATTDWARHAVVLDVPRESTALAFGVLLCGSGRVWIADVQLEVVTTDVPVTEPGPCATLPKGPTNLDFAE